MLYNICSTTWQYVHNFAVKPYVGSTLELQYFDIVPFVKRTKVGKEKPNMFIQWVILHVFYISFNSCYYNYVLDCENSHLSLLLANRDISQGRTSAVSDRNTILIMESMLNIINAVVMESQVQICSMSCFSWSIMVNLSLKLK